ncbi:MAG: HAD family hydrolase [Myxococcota bacterium]
MNTPKVVLWDVMGTLVTEPFLEAMPKHFGMSFSDMVAAKDKLSWIDFEHGLIDEETYCERFFADRRPIDREALKKTMRASYALLPGVESMLRELAAAGFRQYALSNYSEWYKLIEEATGLSRYIGWDFVSCRTGHRKPQPDAYRVPLKSLAVQPDECVFIDDRQKNIDAARDLGLHAILRTPSAEQLRRELVDLGLLQG